MTVLFVVLPLAVVLSGLAATAFLWATRAGQFDDLQTPAVRLLCDELSERAPIAPAQTPAPRSRQP
jgi:cbb3-type cytochrome oxidase maturation protein